MGLSMLSLCRIGSSRIKQYINILIGEWQIRLKASDILSNLTNFVIKADSNYKFVTQFELKKA